MSAMADFMSKKPEGFSSRSMGLEDLMVFSFLKSDDFLARGSFSRLFLP